MQYFKSADGENIIGLLPNGGIVEFSKIPSLEEATPPPR